MIWGLAIDVLIILGLLRAVWLGSRLGLVRVALDFGALVLATMAGFLVDHQLANFLGHFVKAPSALLLLVVFALVWMGVETIYWTLLRPIWNRSSGQGPFNRLLAGGISGLAYLVLAAFVVILLAGLPLPGGLKEALGQSRIASRILASTTQVQSRIDRFINQDLAPTLNFLTTPAQQDDESIALGFRVTNGRVRVDLEQQMLVLVNSERTSRGLKPLVVSDQLRTVARAHSQDMFVRGYFSHITPEGLDPFQRMRQAGITYYAAGENIALAPTLYQAHNGLMNSPPHRANILEPSFGTIGIGIIDGGRYGIMVTQDFTN